MAIIFVARMANLENNTLWLNCQDISFYQRKEVTNENVIKMYFPEKMPVFRPKLKYLQIAITTKMSHSFSIRSAQMHASLC